MLCAIRFGDVLADPESPWSSEALARATQLDPELNEVCSWFDTHTGRPTWKEVMGESANVKVLWKTFDSLKMDAGALYKAWYSEEGTVSHWRIVVPKSLREEFIQVAHTNSTGGHLSAPRTTIQVQRRAFWFGLAKDVG